MSSFILKAARRSSGFLMTILRWHNSFGERIIGNCFYSSIRAELTFRGFPVSTNEREVSTTKSLLAFNTEASLLTRVPKTWLTGYINPSKPTVAWTPWDGPAQEVQKRQMRDATIIARFIFYLYLCLELKNTFPMPWVLREPERWSIIFEIRRPGTEYGEKCEKINTGRKNALDSHSWFVFKKTFGLQQKINTIPAI